MEATITQGTLVEDWTGARLRDWRENLRLSQAELGILLGVSRRSVINWETAEDEVIARSVTLACRYIEEHQKLISDSFRAENEVAIARAAAKATVSGDLKP